VTRDGVGAVLRGLRDPVLLLCLPVAFAVLAVTAGYDVDREGLVGFDFRGALWEPARSLLDGSSLYAEPTRAAVEVGNPSIYPPLAILLAVPFALLPVTAASWAWLGVLAATVVAAIRLLGVRDWRCMVLGVTSPVVLHGLVWGNLTLLLLLPLALAWRYRDRAAIAGLALGAAIAAKLLVWPLVVWLLLTGRLKAAGLAVGSAAFLVLAPWAAVGFDGLASYPALLREVQDVYALHSVSLATAAGGLGASSGLAVACCAAAGLALAALAVPLARGHDGDRRAFALMVAACVVASPIVWPHYVALLLVPVAVTWPRLAPAWLAGYGVWLAGLLLQLGWSTWDAVGTLAVVAAVTGLLVVGPARRDPYAAAGGVPPVAAGVTLRS
jgi:hypothetical protein